MAALLEVVGLGKGWDQTPVLQDLDLVVEAGQHTLISGPSGSGKSTLLMAIARLVEPDAGTIRFAGTPLADMGSAARFRRTNLGLVFQEVHLIESLTVAQNIEIVQTAGADPAIGIPDLLDPMGMRTRLTDKVWVLSRGERQRVALARAFANRPRLLLADEPTASLDAANRERTLDHIFDLCTRCDATALVVSHDAGVAAHDGFAQRWQLLDGRLAEPHDTGDA